ncbi:hypothetical protein EVAR_33746_1 [Eumeta japonica]|uniref:Uncharacterized protein n=1 Tax=Eumeta variegata TaxID=151549 RepID=A0A4C1VV99_EUMVA|nr:hypothetical protein EVAR_33746_1 [Eumeta japonica]
MPKIRHRSTNKAQWSSRILSKAEALRTPYDVAAILNRAYSTVASIIKGESDSRHQTSVPKRDKVTLLKSSASRRDSEYQDVVKSRDITYLARVTPTICYLWRCGAARHRQTSR